MFISIVLTDTLDKRGVLAQLKAQIHAEVFAALDDRSEPRPVLSHENLLINEMIREYLDFNKYKYTSSVLTAGKVTCLVYQYRHIEWAYPFAGRSLLHV